MQYKVLTFQLFIAIYSIYHFCKSEKRIRFVSSKRGQISHSPCSLCIRTPFVYSVQYTTSGSAFSLYYIRVCILIIQSLYSHYTESVLSLIVTPAVVCGTKTTTTPSVTQLSRTSCLTCEVIFIIRSDEVVLNICAAICFPTTPFYWIVCLTSAVLL